MALSVSESLAFSGLPTLLEAIESGIPDLISYA